jgi:hypothetical protein
VLEQALVVMGITTRMIDIIKPADNLDMMNDDVIYEDE